MQTVISADGTKIAYDVQGHGPAVILVDGAFCSRNFGPMPKIAQLLSTDFSVCTYDRRARGDSGDTKPYAIQREIEDIQALISLAGGTAFLYGVSSGAILSLYAAAAGLNIPRLALFEPPFVGHDPRRPADPATLLNKLIAEDRPGAAVTFFLRKLIRVPPIVPFIIKLTPNWKNMVANARALPYDATLCGDFTIPQKQAIAVKRPTLVIHSKQSSKALKNAAEAITRALPTGKLLALKGKQHDVPAETLTPALSAFFKG